MRPVAIISNFLALLAAAHFLAVISPVSVEAAEPNHPQTTPAPQAYTARAWQIDDGLPNNLVRASVHSHNLANEGGHEP